jgi:hypothetical protein
LIVRSFAFGALYFWLPIVVVSVIFGSDLGELLTLLPLTLVLPFLACLVQELLARPIPESRFVVGLAMITGIWATGPFFMLLADTLARAPGVPLAEAWGALGWETALFPFTTFMIAAYHASLYAVLCATGALLLFSAMEWSVQGLVTKCMLRR